MGIIGVPCAGTQVPVGKQTDHGFIESAHKASAAGVGMYDTGGSIEIRKGIRTDLLTGMIQLECHESQTAAIFDCDEYRLGHHGIKIIRDPVGSAIC